MGEGVTPKEQPKGILGVMKLFCMVIVVVVTQTYTVLKFIQVFPKKAKVRCLLVGGLPLTTRPRTY